MEFVTLAPSLWHFLGDVDETLAPHLRVSRSIFAQASNESDQPKVDATENPSGGSLVSALIANYSADKSLTTNVERQCPTQDPNEATGVHQSAIIASLHQNLMMNAAAATKQNEFKPTDCVTKEGMVMENIIFFEESREWTAPVTITQRGSPTSVLAHLYEPFLSANQKASGCSRRKSIDSTAFLQKPNKHVGDDGRVVHPPKRRFSELAGIFSAPMRLGPEQDCVLSSVVVKELQSHFKPKKCDFELPAAKAVSKNLERENLHADTMADISNASVNSLGSFAKLSLENGSMSFASSGEILHPIEDNKAATKIAPANKNTNDEAAAAVGGERPALNQRQTSFTKQVDATEDQCVLSPKTKQRREDKRRLARHFYLSQGPKLSSSMSCRDLLRGSCSVSTTPSLQPDNEKRQVPKDNVKANDSEGKRRRRRKSRHLGQSAAVGEGESQLEEVSLATKDEAEDVLSPRTKQRRDDKRRLARHFYLSQGSKLSSSLSCRDLMRGSCSVSTNASLQPDDEEEDYKPKDGCANDDEAMNKHAKLPSKKESQARLLGQSAGVETHHGGSSLATKDETEVLSPKTEQRRDEKRKLARHLYLSLGSKLSSSISCRDLARGSCSVVNTSSLSLQPDDEKDEDQKPNDGGGNLARHLAQSSAVLRGGETHQSQPDDEASRATKDSCMLSPNTKQRREEKRQLDRQPRGSKLSSSMSCRDLIRGSCSVVNTSPSSLKPDDEKEEYHKPKGGGGGHLARHLAQSSAAVTGAETHKSQPDEASVGTKDSHQLSPNTKRRRDEKRRLARNLYLTQGSKLSSSMSCRDLMRRSSCPVVNTSSSSPQPDDEKDLEHKPKSGGGGGQLARHLAQSSAAVAREVKNKSQPDEASVATKDSHQLSPNTKRRRDEKRRLARNLYLTQGSKISSSMSCRDLMRRSSCPVVNTSASSPQLDDEREDCKEPNDGGSDLAMHLEQSAAVGGGETHQSQPDDEASLATKDEDSCVLSPNTKQRRGEKRQLARTFYLTQGSKLSSSLSCRDLIRGSCTNSSQQPDDENVDHKPKSGGGDGGHLARHLAQSSAAVAGEVKHKSQPDEASVATKDSHLLSPNTKQRRDEKRQLARQLYLSQGSKLSSTMSCRDLMRRSSCPVVNTSSSSPRPDDEKDEDHEPKGKCGDLARHLAQSSAAVRGEETHHSRMDEASFATKDEDSCVLSPNTKQRRDEKRKLARHFYLTQGSKLSSMSCRDLMRRSSCSVSTSSSQQPDDDDDDDEVEDHGPKGGGGHLARHLAQSSAAVGRGQNHHSQPDDEASLATKDSHLLSPNTKQRRDEKRRLAHNFYLSRGSKLSSTMSCRDLMRRSSCSVVNTNSSLRQPDDTMRRSSCSIVNTKSSTVQRDDEVGDHKPRICGGSSSGDKVEEAVDKKKNSKPSSSSNREERRRQARLLWRSTSCSDIHSGAGDSLVLDQDNDDKKKKTTKKNKKTKQSESKPKKEPKESKEEKQQRRRQSHA